MSMLMLLALGLVLLYVKSIVIRRQFRLVLPMDSYFAQSRIYRI